jgi:hypothetical protein
VIAKRLGLRWLERSSRSSKSSLGNIMALTEDLAVGRDVFPDQGFEDGNELLLLMAWELGGGVEELFGGSTGTAGVWDALRPWRSSAEIPRWIVDCLKLVGSCLLRHWGGADVDLRFPGIIECGSNG